MKVINIISNPLFYSCTFTLLINRIYTFYNFFLLCLFWLDLLKCNFRSVEFVCLFKFIFVEVHFVILCKHKILSLWSVDSHGLEVNVSSIRLERKNWSVATDSLGNISVGRFGILDLALRARRSFWRSNDGWFSHYLGCYMDIHN